MSDNFNMYDQANQQGNPNIPPMPPMEEKKGMSIASMVYLVLSVWYSGVFQSLADLLVL